MKHSYKFFLLAMALAAPADAGLYRFDATFEFELLRVGPTNELIGPFTGSGSFVFDTADATLANSKGTLTNAPVTDLSFSISPQPIGGTVLDTNNASIELRFGDTGVPTLSFIEFEASTDLDNKVLVAFEFPAIDFAALNGPVPSADVSPQIFIDGTQYTNSIPAEPATGTLVATPVPEPTSLALLALGGLIAARRRR